MKVEPMLTSRGGCLFNTAAVSVDPAIFDLPATSALPAGVGGRAAVRFAMLGELPVVIKRYHRGGLVRYLSTDLYWYQGCERSRPWREIRLLSYMHSLGLPVPLPVAGRVERVAGVWYRAGLVTGRIEASESLGSYLAHSTLPATQWRALGATIRRFHDAGICHADLNAHNILIDADGEYHLIDFDRSRIVEQSPEEAGMVG